MVSEQTRVLVWKDLLSAEARSLYFGHIASGRQGLERLLALLVGVLSSGAFLALISKWSVPNLAELLAAASAVFGILLTVFSFGKSATLAASIHRKWGEIALELEALFHELPQLDDAKALEKWKLASAKHCELDEAASLEFRKRPRLVRKCQDLIKKGRGLDKTPNTASPASPVSPASRA